MKTIKLLETDRVVRKIQNTYPALGKLTGTKYYPAATSRPLINRVAHRTVVEFENGTIEIPVNAIEGAIAFLTFNEEKEDGT